MQAAARPRVVLIAAWPGSRRAKKTIVVCNAPVRGFPQRAGLARHTTLADSSVCFLTCLVDVACIRGGCNAQKVRRLLKNTPVLFPG